MSGLELVVAAHNAPPVDGGIERLVDGICRHVAPGRALLVRPPHPGTDALPYRVLAAELVGERPPRWSPSRRALLHAPPSSATLVAEWWPEAFALATIPRRRRAGTRAVVIHGTEVVRSLGSPRLTRRLKAALDRMDVVVADSEYTAELAARIGVKTTMIHPGVDLDSPFEEPTAVARELDLVDRPVVLTVARLVLRKGHGAFLPHWDGVLASMPDAVWVIAGDGPERAALEAAAPPSVRVLGRVDDARIAALYRLATVHLMPGIESDGDVEGFGMAAVEAAAAGTPTLATHVGGVAEAIGAGGVVVPAADHAALAAALREVLLDTRRRSELSSAARARAAELSWPNYALRLRLALRLPAVAS